MGTVRKLSAFLTLRMGEGTKKMKPCKSLWILAILVLVSNPAFADSRKFSIGLTSGWAWSLVDEAVGGFPDTEFKSTTIYGASAMYRFSGGFALELAAERLEMDLEESGEGFGTLEMTPVMVLLKWQGMPSGGTGLTWHADIGGGINLTNFNKGSVVTGVEQDYGVQFTIDMDNSYVFELGAGLDYFFSNRFSIGLDGRILSGDVGTSWESSGPTGTTDNEYIDTFHVSNFQVLFGLRFWF